MSPASSTIGVSTCAPDSDPLRNVRNEAFDRLGHSDISCLEQVLTAVWDHNCALIRHGLITLRIHQQTQSRSVEPNAVSYCLSFIGRNSACDRIMQSP